MKKECCICGKQFAEWGNNPWPLKAEGQCCDLCNMAKVLPARVSGMIARGVIR